MYQSGQVVADGFGPRPGRRHPRPAQSVVGQHGVARAVRPGGEIGQADGLHLRRQAGRGEDRQPQPEGRAGLAVSLLNSYYVLLKYVKLLELERRARPDAPA